ncbi:translocation/assembly module TamB domain-containing protein [Granulosicoccus antarcticus]|nr:translocation/assembly module TamB domain-containing protein [Granulosicoccus antarcticus]
MKRLFKWLSRSLLGILALLLLILGIAWFLLGSDKGFSFLSSQISTRIEGLELNAVSGNLSDGIRSEDISFNNDAMAISARGVDTEWRLSCLREREFCLDRIIIDELDVETFATDKPVEEPASGPIVLPTIKLPIDVTVKEVLIRKLSFKAAGDAPAQVLENIRLSANTEGSQLTLENVSASYQDYDAQLAGTLDLDGDYPLDLVLTLNAKDLIPDELPEGEGAQAATVTAKLSNTLRELQIDTHVAGTVNASLSGSVMPLEKNLPATLRLSSPQLGWPIISHQQAKAEKLVADIDGTLDDYKLKITTRLTGEQVPATDLSIAGVANTERVKLPDIAVKTLGGTAKASANVSWKDLLIWDTNWVIKNIDPSLQIPEVSGKLDGNIKASGRVENGNWTLNLPTAKINGTLRNYPFTLDAKLSKGLDDIWLIDKVILNNDQNQINASGKISDRWNLNALLKLPQLQNLLPELAGGFDAKLAVTGALATPSIDLNASSSVIKYNDLLVKGISINADINELFVKPSDMKIAVGTIQTGGQEINNTRLALTGKRTQHQLTLFADGPDATAIDLIASGKLNDSFDWDGSLDKVRLEVPAHTIRLNGPTDLSWNNTLKQFAVDAHCWVTEGSNLCLENKVLAEPNGTATITLDQYALKRLEPFLPAETSLQGSLEMDATVNWGDDQPGGYSAAIDTRISDGGAQVTDANDHPVTFSYEELTLNTRMNPESVEADIALKSKNLGQADISLMLDPAGEEKPIKGTLALNGLDISVAKAFLPDFDEVSGTISLNGDLSGILTDPRFDGVLKLDNPRLRAEALPLPLTGGQILATVKGKRAIITGKLNSDEGAIKIDGSANWQQSSAWRAEVSLNGENLNVQSEPLQESSISHKIRIGAQPGIIRINGDITIPMAVINVDDLPEGAASVSPDIVIIEDIVEDAPASQKAKAGDTKILVGLNVSLGDKVSLSAYGLNARLTGDMSVKMNSPNPLQLGGEIEVVDGIYKQYGQNLEANGKILFVGPVNQTRLAIDAVREIDSDDDDRTAGLRIQGTVAEPEITLFTEPSDKSEDAILSYIVLGRDINEASDQEANLLATAALALTVKGGRNIAGGIANALGVEDFALETRGSGNDTELVVSGRLNERLLVRYGRSVFEPTSTLYLRYDLTKKLYLEAAQGAEDAVDLFYSFSF